MKSPSSRAASAVGALLLVSSAAHAAGYRETIAAFKHAAQSAEFFNNSYGYAVFPTVGEGSFIVGGAHGDGRVYAHGVRVGTASVSQLSIGWQAGGEAYSEIIFFKDQKALDVFESGNFQFGAGVKAVVITAAASASADNRDGMVVFTIVKGGLEGGISLEGEKFSYHAKP